MTTFDAYQTGLILLAADADTIVASALPVAQRPQWIDTLTADIISVLTRSHDDINETAYEGALSDGDVQWSDLDAEGAESIREGMIERWLDDVVCALPEGYTLTTDAFSGAPYISRPTATR